MKNEQNEIKTLTLDQLPVIQAYDKYYAVIDEKNSTFKKNELYVAEPYYSFTLTERVYRNGNGITFEDDLKTEILKFVEPIYLDIVQKNLHKTAYMLVRQEKTPESKPVFERVSEDHSEVIGYKDDGYSQKNVITLMKILRKASDNMVVEFNNRRSEYSRLKKSILEQEQALNNSKNALLKYDDLPKYG